MTTTQEPAHDADALVTEPLVRTETRIGYARVSTGGQKPERQFDALTAAGCRKIFADKKSGKDALRPELKACHAFLDAGDTLVVPSLDRYGRSLQDLINMVAELRERGIGFTSLHENLARAPTAAAAVRSRAACRYRVGGEVVAAQEAQGDVVEQHRPERVLREVFGRTRGGDTDRDSRVAVNQLRTRAGGRGRTFVDVFEGSRS
ncbi:recombinase family protein [Streptomyces sp. NBC_01102]|uniref:recombinase family protein n=1 Tax=Streptomyces sp. NBC_01102 TaxID=2903749 RepID=UPI0038676F36|nr:recombinase family protein [Streptomyces sp. NBC_01102]